MTKRGMAAALCAAAVLACGAEQDLRGFGRCERRTVPHGEVTETVIASSSAKGAETVLGKFLFDLSWQEGLKREGGVVSIPGGNAYALARNGVVARIFSAPDAAAMAAFLAAHPEVEPVTAAPCPEWMKRFDWSLYGVSGLENVHGWMYGAGARGDALLDPREDMDFLVRMGMGFDNWLEPVGFDTSDGITAPHVYWAFRHAREKGVPTGARVYQNCDGSSWTSRRFAEYLEQPAPWMMNGWLRYAQHKPHVSWYQPDFWKYIGRRTQRLMERFAGENVRGWMHPAGELVHQEWYDMHSDYSPAARASWEAFLRRRGVTLAEASRMYSREGSPFGDWAQVEPPEFATFAGLPGMVQDLAGTWMAMADDGEWRALSMPGDWNFLRLYGVWEDEFQGGKGEDAVRVLRRSFDYDPAVARGERVYLYFFPMSGVNVRHKLTLNGAAHEVGTWCALDVTGELRTGANELSVELHGTRWNGRVFLSVQPPAVYPNLGPDRNRLFTLWNDWRREEKAARCADVFAAMRQADPDAPIKFMAPEKFGGPITRRLLSDWGGYAHFTGEGVWYYPWYKRSGKLYGVPGTSELAGPYSTVAEAARSTLRVFMAALDSHQPVFIAQTYSRNAPVRDWWLKRRQLMNRLGRQDIWGPQVLIYRRSTALLDSFEAPYPQVGAATRAINSPYDWDLGRGTLQSLGQSMLYLDDDGVEDGKMYGHPLIVDCGNEVIPAARLAEIEAWVRDGGTFVALPFTARSSESDGDSWPIARLAGAKMAKIRPLGGEVTYEGRKYPDAGRSVSSSGNNLNDHSCELEPAGPDTEAVAFYENGSAAITVRRLGKGRVVWLGSAFWRDAADVEGIWWPGERERGFVKGLLAMAGFPQPMCETDDALVWTQPMRSNDGSSFVAYVMNFNKEGAQTPALKLRLPARPRRLVAYGADGVTAPGFDWADGVATVRLPIGAQEVKVVNADVYGAADAVDYWWKENCELWRAAKRSDEDFSKYDEGKWKDPTQDLKTGWKFEDGRDCVADALQFWGLPDGAPAKISRKFDVEDADWLKGGQIRLYCAAWAGPNFVSPGRLFLNGRELTSGARRHGYLEFDVTRELRPAGNELVLDFEAPAAPNKFTGMIGSIYLYHRRSPDRSVALAPLPGRVFIPKEWEGRYKVMLYMSSERATPLGVMAAAGKFVRKHHHNFGRITDIDITRLLKFGQDNYLEPLDMFKPGDGWKDVSYRLDLYENRGE